MAKKTSKTDTAPDRRYAQYSASVGDDQSKMSGTHRYDSDDANPQSDEGPDGAEEANPDDSASYEGDEIEENRSAHSSKRREHAKGRYYRRRFNAAANAAAAGKVAVGANNLPQGFASLDPVEQWFVDIIHDYKEFDMRNVPNDFSGQQVPANTPDLQAAQASLHPIIVANQIAFNKGFGDMIDGPCALDCAAYLERQCNNYYGPFLTNPSLGSTGYPNHDCTEDTARRGGYPSALDEWMQTAAGLVVVTGQLRSGKSAFANALTHLARNRATYLVLQGEPGYQYIPYALENMARWPVNSDAIIVVDSVKDILFETGRGVGTASGGYSSGIVNWFGKADAAFRSLGQLAFLVINPLFVSSANEEALRAALGGATQGVINVMGTSDNGDGSASIRAQGSLRSLHHRLKLSMSAAGRFTATQAGITFQANFNVSATGDDFNYLTLFQ